MRRFCLLAALAMCAPALTAQTYVELPTWGTADPSISGDGTTVVGRCTSFSSVPESNCLGLPPSESAAYVWTEATGAVRLPGLEVPTFVRPVGVDGDGSVLVGEDLRNTPDGVETVPVEWTRSGSTYSITALGIPDDVTTLDVRDVSADGLVTIGNVGFGQASTFRRSGIEWAFGTVELTSLDGGRFAGVSGDGSVIAGTDFDGITSRASIWTEDGQTFLPLAGSIAAAGGDVSDDGQVVVGTLTFASTPDRAFRWTPERGTIALPPPGGFTVSRADLVSGDGSVVVGSLQPVGTSSTVPALWTEQTGWLTIEDVFALVGLEDELDNREISRVSGISADGQAIAGVVRNRTTGSLFSFYARLGPLPENTIVITTGGDEADLDDGLGQCDVDAATDGDQCTLRAAIQTANQRTGRDSISVDLEGGGPQTVTLTEPLPAITSPLVLDATTDGTFDGRPVLEVDGAGFAEGLVLDQGNTTIRGVALGGFTGAAVRITGPGGNVLEAVHLGTDAPGTAARPNGIGVLIEDSPDNVVGGPRAEGIDNRGAVIAASQARDGVEHSGTGVVIRGAASTGNRVVGSYVGLDATGAAALPNAVGVWIEGAAENEVGGAGDGARIDGPNALRNVISGSVTRELEGEAVDDSGVGVLIRGAEATKNVVAGNYVGTDATGAAALGNGRYGVWISGAPENTVGGTEDALGNVVSASGETNVFVRGAEANENRVLGNRIGTDAAGLASLSAETGTGVLVLFGSENEIGATSGTAGTAPGNLVSGHGGDGVVVFGVAPSDGAAEDVAVADGNRIVSNAVGVDASGAAALPNEGNGVVLLLQAENTLVGVPGGGNVVSGNEGIGVALVTYFGGEGNDGEAVLPPPVGTVIAGNHVGVDRAGTGALANESGGVVLAATFAPPPDDDGDEIVRPSGLEVAARRVVLEDARVGSAARAAARVEDGNSVVVIGGRSRAAGNVIAGNTAEGDAAQVTLGHPWASGAAVVGNRIGLLSNGAAAGSPADGADGVVVNAPGAAVGAVLEGGELYVAGNEVGGLRAGVRVLAEDVVVLGNAIGITESGQARPNGVGVWVQGSGAVVGIDRETEGGRRIAGGNVISGNTDFGVLIGGAEGYDAMGAVPAGATVSDNAIGTTASRSAAVPNGVGVQVGRATRVEVAGNTVSGNGTGIVVDNGERDPVRLAGNVVGLGEPFGAFDESGDLEGEPRVVANVGDGIRVERGGARVVSRPTVDDDDDAPVLPSVVWGNGGSGIRVESFAGDVAVVGAVVFDNGGLGIDAGSEGVGGGPTAPTVQLAAVPDDGAETARLFVRTTGGTVFAYASPRCDPSGFGEGRRLLLDGGTTDGGVGVYDVPIPDGAEATYVTALVQRGGDTSEFSRCYPVSQDAFERLRVEDNEVTRVEGEDTGLEVDVLPADDLEGGPTARMVVAVSGDVFVGARDRAPQGVTFEGEATAPGGRTVAPDAVRDERFWTVTDDGLEGEPFRLCADTALFPGLEAEGAVLVVRDGFGDAFRPLPTALEDGALCATTDQRGDVAVATSQTVTPDALVTLTVSPDRIAEAGGTATVTATLSAAVATDVTVGLEVGGTAGAADIAVADEIVVPAGDLSAGVTLTATDDLEVEGDETVVLEVASVSGGAVEDGDQTVTVTIVDDDPAARGPTVEFDVVQRAVLEGAGAATLRLVLADGVDGPAEVEVALASGDPADLGGFASVAVTIPAGVLEVEVPVPVTNDRVPEGDESFVFTLRILDDADDPAALEVGPQSSTALVVIDDDAGNVTVAVPPRDRDGDGREDGGLRLLALPVSGVPAGELATLAGGPVLVLEGDSLVAPDPSAVLLAGQAVVLEVAAGAEIALTGGPSGAEVTAVATGRLVAIGNPTGRAVPISGLEGALGDVALVFEGGPGEGAFRPISLGSLDTDAVIPPFGAVVVNVLEGGAVTLGLEAAASPGESVADIPFRSDEPFVALSLSPVEGGAGLRAGARVEDVLAVRLAADADSSRWSPDLEVPDGPTLSADLAGAWAAVTADLEAGPLMLPLVLGGDGPHRLALEDAPEAVGPRPLVVEVLDRGAPVVLAPGDSLEVEPEAGRYALRLSLGNAVAQQGAALEAAVGRVFPNPTTGAAALEVTLSEPGPLRVAVYDVLGRQAAVALEGAVPAGTTRVDLEAGLAPGAYVVRVTGVVTETRRLTVTR